MSAPWETNEYWYQEQELKKNRIGGSVFWIIIGVLAMFKTVRRIFFWGGSIAMGYAIYLFNTIEYLPYKQNTLYYVAADPKNSLTYDNVFVITGGIGVVFLVLWVLTATIALVGRTAKKHLED